MIAALEPPSMPPMLCRPLSRRLAMAVLLILMQGTVADWVGTESRLSAQQPQSAAQPSDGQPAGAPGSDAAAQAEKAGETSQTPDQEQPQAEVLPDVAATIVERTNAFRQRNENELDALAVDEQLTETAEQFAQYMAATDKYGHRADGRTAGERARANGYQYCMIRENIAFRRGSSLEDRSELVETFVQGWIDSPEHRENMLADHVTETGVGVATTDGATFYAVQLFGRPESARFAVQIKNETREPQTLTLERQGETDTIDLPPMVRLRLTRCIPTRLSLNDGERSIMLRQAAELVIVTGPDESVQLERVGDDAEQENAGAAERPSRRPAENGPR